MSAERINPEPALLCAMLSDAGTERPDNEDACGSHVESPMHVVVAVADGVSGEEGGEVASRTAKAPHRGVRPRDSSARLKMRTSRFTIARWS
jgi:serine/threonine protein phosphatase PrpC